MIRDEKANDMREHSDVTETRNRSNNNERQNVSELGRNVRDDIEQLEERPSSLHSRRQSVTTGTSSKDRRSSLASFASSGGSECNTPDPEIETSLAYVSTRGQSVRRTKRFLPPDEPNNTHEGGSTEIQLLDSAGLLRNKLLTAAVNNAEEERKLSKDDGTPESLVLDDASSIASSEHSENRDSQGERKDDQVNKSKTETSLEGSETNCLQRKISIHQSANDCIKQSKSAPVEISTTSTCTQTEWSWIEDMKKLEFWKSLGERDAIDGKCNDVSGEKTAHSESKEAGEKINFNDEDSEDELYEKPKVEYSSSSSDEYDTEINFDETSFLPSIGPPKILQYVKESANPPFSNEFPERNATSEDEKHGHSCAFCNAERFETAETLQTSPIAEEVKLDCPVYKEHLKQQMDHQEDDGFVKDELIDIRPHPPFGTKAARKAAKERAAARAREREIERQKVSGNTVNFYAMTRQMKTLTYSLASTKCMDDGWTVKPPTPVATDGGEHLEPFEIEINSTQTQQKKLFLERFYNNGERLLVIFPDGTGCC